MAGKPTIVTDDAVHFAKTKIAQGLYKGEIKKQLRRKFKGTARSHETILARAREALAAETGMTRRDMRSQAKARYESIILDPKANARDKIRAQEALDKLYGLQVHVHRVVGSGEGGALQVEVKDKTDYSKLSVEDLEKLAEIGKKVGGGGG